MHHDKNVSIKFVAEFVGEERETAPAAAPVRAAELRAAGVAVLWAGIDAAPADEGEAAGSSACVHQYSHHHRLLLWMRLLRQ